MEKKMENKKNRPAKNEETVIKIKQEQIRLNWTKLK